MEQLTLLPETQIDAVSFAARYKELLPGGLAGGNPSPDTIASYFSAIDAFLRWCAAGALEPLALTETHCRQYRETLWAAGLKPASVAFKLTAIRRFYRCALRFKLIAANPAAAVTVGRDTADLLPPLRYLTPEQLARLLNVIPALDAAGKMAEESYRDKLIICCMALEGLRTIEVRRLNAADIDWRRRTILIRGRKRSDFLQSSPVVLDMLKQYLEHKTPAKTDAMGTPVFTIVSNNGQARRMSRQAIREAVDHWFEVAGIRQKGDRSGLSCHLLRHTCGVLLYARTGDLAAVKRALRHNDLKTSAKYAAVQAASLERYRTARPVQTIGEPPPLPPHDGRTTEKQAVPNP